MSSRPAFFRRSNAVPAWLSGAGFAVVVLLGVSGIRAADGPATAPTEQPAAAGKPDRHPALKRLSKTEEVWVDKDRKEVVVGAKVVLDDGPIEVFACLENTKEHEAVIAARSTARLVHAALLAVGLDPGRPVSFDPEYRPARGPVVRVMLRWRDAAGQPQEVRAQEWIRNAQTGKPLDSDWVFAGSVFWKDPQGGDEYYQADGGDFICVSNVPTATLDLPIQSSQSNEALLFEVFKGRVPPKGTVVDIVLSAAPGKPAGK
jgi:hypothetical protein